MLSGLPGSPHQNPPTAAQPHKNSPRSPQTPELTKIRDVMWRLVGILRSGKELARRDRATEIP